MRKPELVLDVLCTGIKNRSLHLKKIVVKVKKSEVLFTRCGRGEGGLKINVHSEVTCKIRFIFTLSETI